VERRIAHGRATQTELDLLVQAEVEIESLFEHSPLDDIPPLQSYAPYYHDWLEAPESADESSKVQRTIYERVSVPALHIGGWYDIFINETLSNYRGMRQKEKYNLARSQRLIVGPWAHLEFPGIFPDHDYGPTASIVTSHVVGMQLRWFDRWLKGKASNGTQEPRVRIFVMGADVWRDEEEWPLPDTQYRNYYLHSRGHANTLAGDGELSRDLPTEEPADVYCYDPRNPVPTIGGANLLPIPAPDGSFVGLNTGPRDQRSVEERQDVLCYTTQPLDHRVEVTGPIVLVLAISSSAPDTDFTGKLVDVYPDGHAEILTDGILRARYRELNGKPTLMEPGRIHELRIDIGATSNVFRVGHRIRLEVSSSNFPCFNRNTNTGGTIVTESESDFRQALNHIYHNAAHPSYLILPIIER
jgi:putative CocE/NonD family hydrolase